MGEKNYLIELYSSRHSIIELFFLYRLYISPDNFYICIYSSHEIAPQLMDYHQMKVRKGLNNIAYKQSIPYHVVYKKSRTWKFNYTSYTPVVYLVHTAQDSSLFLS